MTSSGQMRQNFFVMFLSLCLTLARQCCKTYNFRRCHQDAYANILNTCNYGKGKMPFKITGATSWGAFSVSSSKLL